MIERLFKLKKYIPYDCYMTIFDIPFDKLYSQGKRKILVDIDNTLLPYDLDVPDEKLKEFISSIISKGYEIILISNNHKKRVATIANAFGLNYIANSYKPLKIGLRKGIKMFNCDSCEIITIGDQLMTDILGSNRMNLDGILVHPIKRKNEKWYTKINRHRENNILKRMYKKYPSSFEKIVSIRGEQFEK